jgi:hypothetical protein
MSQKDFRTGETMQPQEASPVKQQMSVLGIDIAKWAFQEHLAEDRTGAIIRQLLLEGLIDGSPPEWRELLHARPSMGGMAGAAAAGQDGGRPRARRAGYRFEDTTKPLCNAFFTAM